MADGLRVMAGWFWNVFDLELDLVVITPTRGDSSGCHRQLAELSEIVGAASYSTEKLVAQPPLATSIRRHTFIIPT